MLWTVSISLKHLNTSFLCCFDPRPSRPPGGARRVPALQSQTKTQAEFEPANADVFPA